MHAACVRSEGSGESHVVTTLSPLPPHCHCPRWASMWHPGPESLWTGGAGELPDATCGLHWPLRVLGQLPVLAAVAHGGMWALGQHVPMPTGCTPTSGRATDSWHPQVRSSSAATSAATPSPRRGA